MFGPNAKTTINQNVSSSHRSDEFQSLHKDLTQAFKEVFNLKGYHVLFINGSGTVGIESVIRSTVFDLETIGHEGRFKSRWQQLCNLYNKNKTKKESISCLDGNLFSGQTLSIQPRPIIHSPEFFFDK